MNRRDSNARGWHSARCVTARIAHVSFLTRPDMRPAITRYSPALALDSSLPTWMGAGADRTRPRCSSGRGRRSGRAWRPARADECSPAANRWADALRHKPAPSACSDAVIDSRVISPYPPPQLVTRWGSSEGPPHQGGRSTCLKQSIAKAAAGPGRVRRGHLR